MERSLVVLEKRVPGLTEAALARFVTRACRVAGLRGSLDVLITDSTKIRSLNRQFRGKNEATDVLSFPSPAANLNGHGACAGDIAVSADVAADSAACFGHSVSEEIKVLALHGILHLAGFDHESDNGDMARKETQLRQLLKLPSALIERVHSSNSGPLTRKKRKRYRVRAAL
jgi:probable rRNA maturation factor